MTRKNNSQENYFTVLRYLRNSLIDAERRDVQTESYFRQASEISFEQISNGKLDKHLSNNLIKKYQAKEKEKKAAEQNEQPNEIKINEETTSCPVLLCPIRCLPKNKKKISGNATSLTPLWIPASLSKHGDLSVPSDRFPWIERNYLLAKSSTSLQKEEELLGSVHDEEVYLAKNPPSETGKDWDSYFEWAINFIRHFASEDTFQFEVTNKKVKTFTFGGENFLFDNQAFIAIDSDPISDVTKSILQLYNYLINRQVHAPLLGDFCALDQKDKSDVFNDPHVKTDLTAHLGQMNAAFPLAESQRQALYHYLSLGNGDILAVNGPPGTGKTTLLQSIVANLFVEKALNEKEPPVIIASSANNQAITNIIESFENDADNHTTLTKRWLPAPVSGYALYCPSFTKQDKARKEKLLYTNILREGFPKEIENYSFLDRATEDFCKNAEEYFNASFETVREVKEHLHAELKKMFAILENGKKLFNKFDNTANDDSQKLENLSQIERQQTEIEFKKENTQQAVAECSKKLDQLKSLQTKWESHFKTLPFYVRWFSGLFNSYRRKVINHNQYFFKNCNNTPDQAALTSHKSVSDYFLTEMEMQFKKRKNNESQIATLAEQQEQLGRLESWFQSVIGSESLESIDTTVRHKMFQYATHYWEARWIIETNQYLAQEDIYSRERAEEKWRRYAMLTPCFISTFYMAPKYFSYWEPGMDEEQPPLNNFADLLIVDEAGQVSPEIGASGFALAKKALVVGDTNQIQPIWGVNNSIDYQNFETLFGPGDYEYSSFKQTGKTAQGGSIMRVAQKRSPFQLEKIDSGGMFLSEHWRCVPEIIDYCNTLVYRNELHPQRKREQPYPLPRFGFAHISGQSKRDNGASRYNEEEAKAIVSWIAEHRWELIDRSEAASIEDVIAVVTPFKKQKLVIEKLLKEADEELTKITVGTVHALQGAEREVVLFSSVYTQKDSSHYFFDNDVMMLNVAVSRAKESFLVFGDMHIFNQERNTPSGLLARYLFSDAGNELTDINPPEPIDEARPDEQLQVEQIDKLKRHQRLLNYCFQQAEKNITIASPFITEYALKSDNIPQLIEDAIERGVEVTCYVDSLLNKNNADKYKPSARRGMNLLKEAGATLKIVKNFHNKTLSADEFLLCEGSFNWLSAQRNQSDKYRRYERSLVYLSRNKAENETIQNLIRSFKQDMNVRIVS